MNRLTRWVVDAYRELARRIHYRRYGTLVRQLDPGRTSPIAEQTDRTGFIVIQIDGLAYDHLLQALARGSAPYLKRLIGAGRLRMSSWRCGLPSTTPASQAGIMFGENWNIPGFRWYDKERGRPVVCKLPATIQALQERVSRGRAGILDGGSSYYNMFDGDAEWSVFTLSTLRAPRFFEGVRGLGLVLLFLMSPLRVFRVIRLAAWNYLLETGRRLRALFRPSVYRPFDLLSPMAHIFTSVLFQEIITFGVQIDIYRGAPAIYLNNASYDEVAHNVGPIHTAAFGAVRNIDRQVAQIDRMVRRHARGKYDLFILSDHGMSPSIPFKRRFGLSLGDFILQQIGEPLIMDEQWGGVGHTSTQAQFLLDELHRVEARLSPRSAAVVRAACHYFSRRLPGDGGDELFIDSPTDNDGDDGLNSRWDRERHSDVVVRVSGSLAHVYFNITQQRLNLSHIALLYPTLLKRLIEHPGIGMVVGREDYETIILGHSGTLTVQRDLNRIQGSNPLVGLADPPEQAARIARLASFPTAGDLIIFGAWDRGMVTTFEDQRGTHGGLGGPQERPFILHPAEHELPSGTLQSPCDLYPIFARYKNPSKDGGNSEGV